jgi:hypothetical protein
LKCHSLGKFCFVIFFEGLKYENKMYPPMVGGKLRMRAVARFFVDQNKLSDYDKFEYQDNF